MYRLRQKDRERKSTEYSVKKHFEKKNQMIKWNNINNFIF